MERRILRDALRPSGYPSYKVDGSERERKFEEPKLGEAATVGRRGTAAPLPQMFPSR